MRREEVKWDVIQSEEGKEQEIASGLQKVLLYAIVNYGNKGI